MYIGSSFNYVLLQPLSQVSILIVHGLKYSFHEYIYTRKEIMSSNMKFVDDGQLGAYISHQYLVKIP